MGFARRPRRRGPHRRPARARGPEAQHRRLRAAERGGRLELPRPGRGRGDDGPLRPHGLPAHRPPRGQAQGRRGARAGRHDRLPQAPDRRAVAAARRSACSWPARWRRRARIILLDEPFTGVDVKTEDAIVALLRELQGRGPHSCWSPPTTSAACPTSATRWCWSGTRCSRPARPPTSSRRPTSSGPSAACCATSASRARQLHDDDDAAHAHRAHRRRAPRRVLRRAGRQGRARTAADRARQGRRAMSELASELLVPFAYDYMVKAIWVSALVGGLCAFLSAYLMLQGWSLMGDALSHSIVPGVAAAYLLKLPYAAGAFFAGTAGRTRHGARAAAHAAARGRRHRRRIHRVLRRRPADRLARPTAVNIQSIVLGNILGISDDDALQVAIIGVVSLAILLAKWKDLMAGVLRSRPRARSRPQSARPEDAVLHAAQRLHRRRAADGRRLPRHRHGGDAGRDRLPAHRPLRPPAADQRGARRR